MLTSADEKFMRRAMELAARGQYATAPNPMVGCVIVSEEGTVIGEAGTVHTDKHMPKPKLMLPWPKTPQSPRTKHLVRHTRALQPRGQNTGLCRTD